MKITATYPVTTKTVCDLDESERFDFTRRHGSERRYRATRIYAEWVYAVGAWSPRVVEWSGPLIRKNGALSDAAAGTERAINRMMTSGLEVPREVAQALSETCKHLPVVLSR